MYLFVILYSFFFIGIGFFFQKYPDTIAGYSTLSPERKREIDIGKLAVSLRNILVGTGAGILLLFFLFAGTGMRKAALLMLLVVPVIGVLIAVSESRKYGLHKKK